ncbi:MAG: gamma-glutamylcyclotransferase [Sphingobacteriales bacterium]|nr:MAG: gamma-glutamylcyclotransferase [Sphingobacteriales bacterium]
MDLDKIIKELNKKITSNGVSVDKLDSKDLTEAEKDFIEKFKPGQSIILYGTLAPGKPNHSKIEHIKGEWLKGIVKGKLVKEGWGAELGYYGFKHSNVDEQVNIEAYILFSNELVDHWSYLDEFEGDGYQRILAKFELENGEVGVGNIYAINGTN